MKLTALHKTWILTAFALIFTSAAAFGATPASLDIKPGSCTNPVNIKTKGVLPMAVLGGNPAVGGLDVSLIDPATIGLSASVTVTSTGATYDLGSLAPAHFKKVAIEDVTAPVTSETCEEEMPDGFADLLVRFRIPALVKAVNDALALQAPGTSLANRDTVVLTLTATLTTGDTISGSDTILIKKPGRK